MKQLFILCSLVSVSIFAQSPKDKMLDNIGKKEMYYGGIAKQIWNYAEVGYQETKSSTLLQLSAKKVLESKKASQEFQRLLRRLLVRESQLLVFWGNLMLSQVCHKIQRPTKNQLVALQVMLADTIYLALHQQPQPLQ